MAQQNTQRSFEQALARIEEIVLLLEGGASPLDVSLQLFQEAASLAEFCNSSLNQAQQQVEQLTNAQPSANSVN